MANRATAEAPGFFRRLADRTQPCGVLLIVEDRLVVVRILTIGLGIAVVMSAMGAVTWFTADEPGPGVCLAVLSASFVAVWVWWVLTGQIRGPIIVSIVVAALSSTYIQVALGGYLQSGGTLMWSFTLVVVAAMILGRTATFVVAAIFMAEAIVFGFLESTLAASRTPPDPAVVAQSFVIALVGNLLVVTPMIVFLLGRLSFERERAEGLLENVLPVAVAVELKEHGRVEPRRLDAVTVLFADIVDFTPRSAALDPTAVVDELNEVFTRFDALAAEHGCEKIRTIGDAYMVVSGAPEPRTDHADAAAAIALAMRDYAEQSPFSFRIGLNSGPVVAGVIGTAKFQYDVWGDTVNTASRMESQGVPGRIQMTEATYGLLVDRYQCSSRGVVDVKGKGPIPTYFLEGGRDT